MFQLGCPLWGRETSKQPDNIARDLPLHIKLDPHLPGSPTQCTGNAEARVSQVVIIARKKIHVYCTGACKNILFSAKLLLFSFTGALHLFSSQRQVLTTNKVHIIAYLNFILYFVSQAALALNRWAVVCTSKFRYIEMKNKLLFCENLGPSYGEVGCPSVSVGWLPSLYFCPQVFIILLREIV